MKDRLLQLLSKLNYSATRLADELNVQRSGISHILSGRNQPSYDFMVKILNRFPEIDAEALRVINSLPSFDKPGLKDGRPVPVWYMVPITFALK